MRRASRIAPGEMATRRLAVVRCKPFRRVVPAGAGGTVAAHSDRVQLELDRFRGRLVKTTGDGVLALFDGSERAVRAAAAICLAAKSLGLAIRAGVHTGEVELVAGDVRGMAVHVAARIMALAGPSQVYVSAPTPELLVGSGLGVGDARSHQRKGVSGAP